MSETSNAFVDTIGELRNGDALPELHHKLRQLVGQVRSVAKKGSITLTITVAPAKGNADILVLSDEITVKEPKVDRSITVMYPDQENRLSRRDPRQPRLPTMTETRKPTTPFARPVAVGQGPESVDKSTGEIIE